MKLVNAIRCGDYQSFQTVLSKTNVDVTKIVYGQDRYNLLHLSAYFNQEICIKYLIEYVKYGLVLEKNDPKREN